MKFINIKSIQSKHMISNNVRHKKRPRTDNKSESYKYQRFCAARSQPFLSDYDFGVI